MNKISLEYLSGIFCRKKYHKEKKSLVNGQKKLAMFTLLTCVGFPGISRSSTVSAEIDYLIFRDFAENKGVFIPGVENISIPYKDGSLAGFLDKSPMPDFSSVNVRGHAGVATLIHPQYIASVKHNRGYNAVQFGNTYSNPDNNHFSYSLVDRNEHTSIDFHLPRLNKLVTEVTPAEINTASQRETMDKNRFTTFYRLGSGTQYIQDINGKRKTLSGAYNYLTGGTVPVPLQTHGGATGFQIYMGGNINNYGLMASLGESGDSGSPLFGWDAKNNKWVLVAVYSAIGGGTNPIWKIVNESFLNQSLLGDTDPDVIFNSTISDTLEWSFNETSGTGTIVQGSNIYDMHGQKDNNLNTGKNLTFYGRDGQIDIKNNVIQGAGTLTFKDNYTVLSSTGSIWSGGGIFVEKDTKLKWQVNGKQGDALHKIGEGTLHINATGTNEGDLRVGDGTVILDQQLGDDGKKQAFKTITLTSGRPTVVLSDSLQVNPDNIYFGYRGGRLDVNGNDLTFNRIKNADSGAHIVNNNNSQEATITINGRGMNNTNDYQTFQGFIGETDTLLHNGKLNLTYAPKTGTGILNLSGGANLNGEFSVQNGGTLILSGNPILHAGNTFIENDWNSTEFTSRNINIGTNSSLQLSEYITLNSNVHAMNGSSIFLGYVPEETQRCMLNQNNGQTSCTNMTLDNILGSGEPTVRMNGNITLEENSQMNIGRGVFTGKVSGSKYSILSMTDSAIWNMKENSSLGSLKMLRGAHIDLSGAPEAQIGNILTVQGDLQGEGHFTFNARIADNVSDRVVVEGKASGKYTLNIRNNGGETIQDSRMITLMSMKNPEQDFSKLSVTLTNGHVDIGTWRYRLTRDGYDYKLYNPITGGEHNYSESVLGNTQKPTQSIQQANWISRETNTVISTFTGNFNLLNKQIESTQRHVNKLKSDESGWWLSFQAEELKYGNRTYRPYTQKLLTQSLGVDHRADKTIGIVQWGGALITSVSDSYLDEGIKANDSMNGINLYGKLTLESGGWLSGYAGIHHINNSIKGLKKVDRSGGYGYVAGIGVGYNWQAPAEFTIAPQTGINLYGLPSQQYSINNNIEVSEPSSKTVQYYAGVNISRNMEIGDIPIAPYAEFMHKVNSNSENIVSINGNKLKADFVKEQTNFTLGNSFKIDKSLKVDVKGDYTIGGGLKDSKCFSLGIKYIF
ncbi:TPA: S6 family peptidase [Escherichia coli]|nr:autotransporter outer membrane beta-barrel domain-containing protein [Escherichia coli]EIT1009156.1 autotransporter outer membrane beta-barrel domain-containing protein [Escherichia coli]